MYRSFHMLSFSGKSCFKQDHLHRFVTDRPADKMYRTNIQGRADFAA